MQLREASQERSRKGPGSRNASLNNVSSLSYFTLALFPEQCPAWHGPGQQHEDAISWSVTARDQETARQSRAKPRLLGQLSCCVEVCTRVIA